MPNEKKCLYMYVIRKKLQTPGFVQELNAFPVSFNDHGKSVLYLALM